METTPYDYFEIYIKIRICINNINGIPILNFSFCVLCLKINIESVPPTEPPIIERKIKLDSGILHLFLLALYLSIKKTTKVIILIKIK